MALSKIKLLALDISNELHIISLPYIKSKLVKEFLVRFGKPRIDKIIAEDMTDEEVKKVLWDAKQKLDDYFKKMDKAQELFNNDLNSNTMTERLKKLPDFKTLSEYV